MPRGDRWLGGGLVLAALGWVWLVQTQIPDPGTTPGPRGFPRLFGVVLAALGGWIIAVPSLPAPAPERRPDGRSDRHELAGAGGAFGVLVLYAFLLERTGFLIATPAIVVAAMVGLLRLRHWLSILSLAAGLTLGVWTIFEALGTPLPRGTWIGW